MNQSILFPDIQSYDSEIKAVRFPAQQQGALIECWVSLRWLEKALGQPCAGEAAIMAAFNALRFDIEEEIEALIEEEAYNAKGEVALA
ncbi:DUF1488 domain-containing protein [Thaumasiovibrio sp. DFM-14]|uniref:DUF1488 domain-containing protein n=1 Tax=Thaumasiovibrio sp. DFM-14 TaxID=3384792 RepID=UPI0039A2A459